MTLQSITQHSKLLDQAIRVRTEFNLCMIPSGQKKVESDGKLSFKRPFVGWEEYNQPDAALPTVEQMEEWDRQFHPSLWGFVTGRISGVTVFDADSPEAIFLFFAVGLEPHVVTMRGQHYYFEYPGPEYDHLIYSVNAVIPHVDIKSQGGFVNCLGANSTASYRMVQAPTFDNLYHVRQLPPEVVAGIAALQNSHGTRDRAPIGDSIPEGARDSTIFRLACCLRSWGFDQLVIEEALLYLNSRVCKPPLPDSIVLQKAKRLDRYPAGVSEIDLSIATSDNI